MKHDEETELRNAVKWMRKLKGQDRISIERKPWARMLERAADRIAELEAAVEGLAA